MIYNYCFISASDIIPYPSNAERSDTAMSRRDEKQSVALLQLNRKIGIEARAVRYGKSTFHVSYQTYPRLRDSIWRSKNFPLFRYIATNLDCRDVTEITILDAVQAASFYVGRSGNDVQGDVARHVTKKMLDCCRYKLQMIEKMQL